MGGFNRQGVAYLIGGLLEREVIRERGKLEREISWKGRRFREGDLTERRGSLESEPIGMGSLYRMRSSLHFFIINIIFES